MKFLPITFLLAFLANPAHAVQTSGNTSVCFTLAGEDCALAIVAVIESAHSTIDLEAYNYTEPRIISAVVAAHARGVNVRVILDKSVPTEKNGGAQAMVAAGIPTFIDYEPRIAHNKIIVVDGQTVETGSFNYSTNADRFNAENVLIVHDPVLAGFYEQNFQRRLAVSKEFTDQ